MYLSEIKIQGYRSFNSPISVELKSGMNVFVGENGCGKSTVIDAIRLLLNEDEYMRAGIKEEDFFASADQKEKAERIVVKGKFSDLDEDKKAEYLTWLDSNYDAILNVDITKKKNGMFRKNMWGGEASNSFFEWEVLDNIQCVYLPPLRDAEKKLRATRGSRLARLLLNLAGEELQENRKQGKMMDIEEEVNNFNKELSKRKHISKANELINDSLEKALGGIFGQATQIRFSELSYERIVEALRIVFFPSMNVNDESVYRNLFENSLGYNNLIYIATILAEFEGLKENYTSPRILLIEEIEAHLHPQIQIKLLKYLEEQADRNGIQVIITTHSTTIAASTSIENIVCFTTSSEDGITITALRECRLEEEVRKFIDRWLDTTKSTLLFSKGVILVEGLAEAMLIPKLAQIYLLSYKENTSSKYIPSTLEEAGISVINMNGIFFPYFMQLFRGYQLKLPKKKSSETKTAYKERIKKFKHKSQYKPLQITKTAYIPIRCVALTDNDPGKKSAPKIDEVVEGNNSQLFYIEQLKNMTSNCRVYTNKKTFEYDMALYEENASVMIDVILENLETDGSIKEKFEGYKREIKDKCIANNEKMALDILNQIDSNYMGKGLFAQILLEKIEQKKTFTVPQYIKEAIDFVLEIGGDDEDESENKE